MRKWTIYKIVSPSGRVYIGKTSRFKKRMSYYKLLTYKGPSMLCNSLKKYGFDAHAVQIIDSFKGEDDYASGKEIFWIRSFMSNYCKWPEMKGLNLTDGGEGTTGYKASEEHKKRLSEMHKRNPSRGMLGKKLSDETKKKLSDYNKANPSRAMLGKKMSEETKAKIKLTKDSRRPYKLPKRRPTKEETRIKMSLAKIGKAPPNKGKPMPKHQVELLRQRMKGKPSPMAGKTFHHLSDDERKIRFGKHNIGNSYNKGRKHSSEIVEARRLAATGRPNIKLYKPIIQYDLSGQFIKEHDSIKSASIELGINYGTIGDIVRGGIKNPSTFRFKFKAA